jgi:iron complex transport system ATP-binding protein
MLRCDRIGHVYGSTRAVQDVTLQVRPGEVLAIVGPNGAGKTTLLRILARLLEPSYGSVRLHGEASDNLDAREFAKNVAFVAQNETASPMVTVEDAVELGRAPHRGWFLPFTVADRSAVDSSIRALGLARMRHRMLGELSGGERRRVALARALAQDPRVLLLDEPTVHLDLRRARDLCEMLRARSRQGIALAVTLHDLNEASFWADRVAIMLDGRVVCAGRPEEVITEDSIRRIYRAEVTVQRRPDNGRPCVISPGLEGLS